MKKFKITIRNKKTRKEISTIINDTNDIGIMLKGEIKLIPEIKFDKRKHEISFIEI